MQKLNSGSGCGGNRRVRPLADATCIGALVILTLFGYFIGYPVVLLMGFDGRAARPIVIYEPLEAVLERDSAFGDLLMTTWRTIYGSSCEERINRRLLIRIIDKR